MHDRLSRLKAALDAKLAAKTYEQEERIAIQEEGSLLSADEALALHSEAPECEEAPPTDQTWSATEDSLSDSNMTHFSRHNCSGITVLIEGGEGTSDPDPEYARDARDVAKIGEAQRATKEHASLPQESGSGRKITPPSQGCIRHIKDGQGRAGDVAKMGATFPHTQNQNSPPPPSLAQLGGDQSGTATTLEQGLEAMNETPGASAKADLLLQNIAAILSAHFDVSSIVAPSMALTFLTVAKNERIDNPIALLEELSLKWAMQLYSPYASKNPGDWLFKEVGYYAQKRRRDAAFSGAPAQRQATVKVNWDGIRQSIINCGRVGGQPMRGADLKDYYDHVRSNGGRFDSQVSHALCALEAAGLIERRSGGVSVRAETLEIRPEKKDKVSLKKAMEQLRAEVIRAYPESEGGWETKVDELFPFTKIWRTYTCPDMLLGMADVVKGKGR